MLFQPTEMEVGMHASITAWCQEYPSILPALALNVMEFGPSGTRSTVFPPEFADGNVDIMICINMIHISPIACTHALFSMAGQMLRHGGVLLTYGPYRVNGTMVASNVAFDESLKGRYDRN
jgi:hypothetical protein